MAELRWILLLAGLIFMAALTVWELRRPRQGRGAATGWSERNEPALGSLYEDAQTPTASLVSLHPGVSVPAPAPIHHDGSRDARQPLIEPIHVELPPLEPSLEAPELAFEPAPESSLESSLESPLVISFDEPQPQVEPAFEARHAAQDESSREEDESQGALPEDVRVQEDVPAAAVAAAPLEPIVEWPPEEQRQILSIRVVGMSPDRMAGRPLRQALAACGFVHGRFGIFHQPGADGRALVSAANLNKPGMFDPTSMDFQRFSGLGLFAVLPGPLPPAAALDHLLDTAGDLAQRLHARLQDEHGMPFDEERLEAMARIVQGMTNGALRTEPTA